MNGKIWTISNMLSMSRIVLMIPAMYYFVTPMQFHREIALLIILVAVATDALDGYVARIRNEVSEFGKIIDPLADKVSVAVVVVMLTIYGDIPLWFTLVVLGRDVIIFIAGLYVKRRTGIILPSLMSGKVAVSFLALTLVFPVLQYPSLDDVYHFFQWFTLALLAYSFTVYAQRFFSTLRAHRTGSNFS
ncbi:MAG: CDP-alcohol phosphatidyltransferase family protein [Bacteroidetes bacterium]|nr:CDP-alcohol phosphatidyltransferase family protein [Bacteroidota bacterium]